LTNHRTPVAPGWLAGSPADIRWARWDGDFVAYHCPSGKTHLLNAASELLITRILSEVKTTSEIVEELASLQSRPIDSTYTESIVKLVERLEQLGLIDRV
jgi:PqqD family protein of HPr-rel-A system